MNLPSETSIERIIQQIHCTKEQISYELLASKDKNINAKTKAWDFNQFMGENII